MIFNGKKVIEATWSKKSKRSTISFKGEDGARVTIDPGKVFIELVPKGDGSVSLG